MSILFGDADPKPAGPQGANAKGGAIKSGNIKDGSDATFMADVIEASRAQPVIVDFWATWCGPCKQLGPALEKAVEAAKGAVKLVKIDVDKNPAIAGQLRIQSIPTVYAFVDGRPVDGFQGALPESQVKQFVERLIGPAEPGVTPRASCNSSGEPNDSRADPITSGRRFRSMRVSPSAQTIHSWPLPSLRNRFLV